MEAKNIKEIVEYAFDNSPASEAKKQSDPFIAILRGLTKNGASIIVRFGKHAGSSWRDLPDDYKEWIIEQMRQKIYGPVWRKQLEDLILKIK